MSNPFVGEIRMVGFNFNPRAWALCNGQLMSIAQNAALFSLLGTTYGGDGVQTFALPNLQSRVPVHQGTGPGLSTYVIGQNGGTENANLLISNMPAHTHVATFTAAGSTPLTVTASVQVASVGATVTDPNGSIPAQSQQPARVPVSIDSYAATSAATGSLGGVSATIGGGGAGNVTVGAAGGNQPFSIVEPYLCINFIIALQGIFPSRN